MLLRLPPIALLASLAGAQAQIVVDASGGGHFTQIQPAIDVARAGDVIVVRAGTYGEFLLEKGVAIVGEPGSGLTPGSRGPGLIRIENVPAGEVAAVTNLGNQTTFGVSLDVRACDGLVHLEGLRVGGGLGTPRLDVASCDRVSLHRVEATRLVTTVADSILVATQCEFGGLRVTSSRMTFAESRAVGATIEPTILLTQSRLVVAGDAATEIRAFPPHPFAPSLDCIRADAASAVRVDPQVTFIPTGTGVPIAGAGTVDHRSVPSLRVATGGAQLVTRLRAPGALRGHTLIGPPASPLLLPFGDWWLAWSVVIDSGAMPINGERGTALAIPTGLTGLTLVVQAIVAQPNQIELSTPVFFTLS